MYSVSVSVRVRVRVRGRVHLFSDCAVEFILISLPVIKGDA